MAENPNTNEHFDGKSAGKMLVEIGRLLLLLLLGLLKLLWRWLKKGLRWILKWICKGLLLLIDVTDLAIQRTRAFWNDNDTQEKLRKTRIWLLLSLRKLAKWSLTACISCWNLLCWLGKHLWLALIWFIKALIRGIIHLGPTLRAVGRSLAKAARATWRWIVRVCRWMKLGHLRRKRAYQRFRKNKGFKGLLVDVGSWLRLQLNNYLDETPAPEEGEVDDDDDFNPFDDDDETVNHSKMHSLGRSIYNAMKKIVEDD